MLARKQLKLDELQRNERSVQNEKAVLAMSTKLMPLPGGQKCG
jgi:hypothetical protein